MPRRRAPHPRWRARPLKRRPGADPLALCSSRTPALSLRPGCWAPPSLRTLFSKLSFSAWAPKGAAGLSARSPRRWEGPAKCRPQLCLFWKGPQPPQPLPNPHLFQPRKTWGSVCEGRGISLGAAPLAAPAPRPAAPPAQQSRGPPDRCPWPCVAPGAAAAGPS